MSDENTCPDCGLPHPATNPYCFCMTPTASIAQMNKAAEDFASDHAAALTEAQATIAQQQVMLDRALESNGDMQATIARLEAALIQIRDRAPPYPQFAWAMGIAGLALAALPPGKGE